MKFANWQDAASAMVAGGSWESVTVNEMQYSAINGRTVDTCSVLKGESALAMQFVSETGQNVLVSWKLVDGRLAANVMERVPVCESIPDEEIGVEMPITFIQVGKTVNAKVDTGASVCSLDARNIQTSGGRVSFVSPVLSDSEITLNVVDTHAVQSADGGTQDRVVVSLDVKINDKVLYEYVEPDGVTGTRRIGKGSFALQAHDPKSVVKYRNIMVKPLAD